MKNKFYGKKNVTNSILLDGIESLEREWEEMCREWAPVW